MLSRLYKVMKDQAFWPLKKEVAMLHDTNACNVYTTQDKSYCHENYEITFYSILHYLI